MYLAFYGLREEPFGSTPDPRFLFASAMHREAMASLQYCIETGRGFFALIAPPGMGKTTLLFQTLEKYRETASTAFVFNTQCSSREFIRFLLSEVGIDEDTDDVVRMHRRFNEFLLANSRLGRRFILVVDEAQNLQGDVLETIRLLSDFETSRAKLMQIVLAGQPELEQTLRQPGLSQLLQRIPMISRIDPLTLDETAAYVAHRLEFAGYRGAPIFTDGAMEMISRHSHGIPRLINTICFNALSLGYASESKQIDADLMEEAVADLPYVHTGPLPVRRTARKVSPVSSQATRVPHHVPQSAEPIKKTPLVPPSIISTAAPTIAQPMNAKAATTEPAASASPVLSTATAPAVTPARVEPTPVEKVSGDASAHATPRIAPVPPRPVAAQPVAPKSPATSPSHPAPNVEMRRPAVPSPRATQPVATAKHSANAAVLESSVPFTRGAYSEPEPSRRSFGLITALLILLCCAAAGYFIVRHRVNTLTSGQTEQSKAVTPSSTATTSLASAPVEKSNAVNSNVVPPPPIDLSNGQVTATSRTLPSVAREGRQLPESGASAGQVAPIVMEEIGRVPSKTEPPPAMSAPEVPVPSAGRDAQLIASARTTSIPNLVKPAPAIKSGDPAVVPPQLIRGIRPEYPAVAKKNLSEGEVVLTAMVSQRGIPENLKFVRGDMEFKQVAFDAVKQWKYRPGTFNGKPAEMPVEIRFKFSRAAQR